MSLRRTLHPQCADDGDGGGDGGGDGRWDYSVGNFRIAHCSLTVNHVSSLRHIHPPPTATFHDLWQVAHAAETSHHKNAQIRSRDTTACAVFVDMQNLRRCDP